MFEATTTNSVQAFIRSIAWMVSFTIISLTIVVPLYFTSENIFGTGLIFAVPALAMNAWLSGIFASMFFILPEWQSIVLLKLGKYDGTRKAGFIVIPPFIYSVASIVDMRIETQQVEATATLTKDNVPTKVTTAIEFRVEDPRKAIIDVQDYRKSVTWLSTEALKNTIGSLDLKELLSERDQIAAALEKQIDSGASVYGVDVRAVRITDIDTPKDLIDELAIIARARRAADAMQIDAHAEVEAAKKYAEAAQILAKTPGALKLRELTVISEASKDGNMIIIYPHEDVNAKNVANNSISLYNKTKSNETN